MTTSWVIVERDTRKAVLETFNEKTAARLNVGNYEAIPILKYLTDLNAEIKKESMK